MKVTDYIAKFISYNGIDTVFGYQGSSIAHLIDSIACNPYISFIETRHEQAAAFAANAYAMAANKVGVAVACSGPGALNIINGIANSFYDSIPCLFITGQVGQHEMRNGSNVRQVGFQETDIVSIIKPITKYAVQIQKPEDILIELPKAYQIAIDGRPGPVLLDIPHNIQYSQIEWNGSFIKKEHDEKQNNLVGFSIIRNIIQSLEIARKPVFLIGGGCKNIALETVDKCEKLGIAVVTSYLGKNNYDNYRSNYIGTIGVFGERYANWALKYSDLVIVFGSRLDGRQTAGEKLQKNNSNVIVIDIDKNELDNLPDYYIKIKEDATKVLDMLMKHLTFENYFNSWLSILNRWKREFPIENEYFIGSNVNPNLLLKKISRFFAEKCVVSLDVGQNQLWSNTSLCIGKSQQLLQSGGLGSMGYSLPASIGAYFATKSQVVSINGDGGVQMNLQELQTVREYKIPLKLLVFNNRCLGLIRDYQSKVLGNRYNGSIDGFGSPEYEFIAKAYGLRYLRISENEDIDNLNSVFEDNVAYLIEVIVNQYSTAFPEPTYQSVIENQSPVISDELKNKIMNDVRKCL